MPLRSASPNQWARSIIKPPLVLGSQAIPVSGPGSFGDLVEKAVSGTLDTGRAAEAKALAMADGKASIVDVVTAVAETELAVETLVTVRDKVISAYKDILNMPI